MLFQYKANEELVRSVKPNGRKKVAEQLTKMGIECYCPLITQVRQWSDRKKKVVVPLFNSYVFVQVADS
jgi:hypothetical protein